MSNMVQIGNERYQNTGSSKYYVTNSANMRAFSNWLMKANFTDDFKLLFTDKGEYVISSKVFPFDVAGLFGDSSFEGTIVGATRRITLANDIVANGVGRLLKRDKPSVARIETIATITFNPHYNSFLDLNPYTQAQIYLPYCEDMITLDLNTYYNKTVNIGFTFDIVTGECLYDFRIGNDVIEIHKGKCGINLAISQTNSNEIARNFLLAGLGTISKGLSVASSGVYKSGLKMASSTLAKSTGLEVGRAVVGSATDIIDAGQQHFEKTSASSGYMDFFKPQNIYIIYSRPNVVAPNDYNAIYGKPSAKNKLLSELTGFTKVAELHLTSLGNATSREIEEVETLLKEGVIL